MSTISIQVAGEELEIISIELTSEEVRALYNLRKEQSKKIEELTKELDSGKKSHDYTRSSLNDATAELHEGHTLLTALGVKDKTDHEESYYRKDLKIATRIALYIAANK
jgi:hypothetical protein